MRSPHLKHFLSEFVGTFILVFAGTGAIITNGLFGGMVTHAGVAISFGLAVMVMVYAVGDVSGAHLNPAVTIGFWIAGRFPVADIPGYLISQVLGAAMASSTLSWIFGKASGLGATQPSIPVMQAFTLEILLTFLLMFVILQVADGSKEKGPIAGIAIGGTVLLAAIFAGPATGASMNPARTLGPALFTDQRSGLWIYFSAPWLGACAAGILSRWLQPAARRKPANGTSEVERR